MNYHDYNSEKELYQAIDEFAYVKYNHIRPYAFNNYLTPFEARYGVENFYVQMLQKYLATTMQQKNKCS